MGQYTRKPVSEIEREIILKEKAHELYNTYGAGANIHLSVNEYGDVDYEVKIKKSNG